MAEIHVVVRRINPAIKIDLAQIGRINDGHFEPLPFSVVENTPIARFLKSSNISDSLYIDHSEVLDLLVTCGNFPGSRVDFFDNTMILVFDPELNYDESTTKEEGKRH